MTTRAARTLVVGTVGLVGVMGCSSDENAVDTTPDPTSPAAGSPIDADGPVVIEELFAAPAHYEDIARSYCAAWPDVGDVVRHDAAFARVPADGFDMPNLGGRQPHPEGVVHGAAEVLAAAAALGYGTVDCTGPALVFADWVALPVSASNADGSGDEGIWVLRIVDDEVHWHLIYGNVVGSVGPPAREPDPALVAEARQFCSIIEGTGYVRDVDEFLNAMTGDPAVHNNPEGFFWTGTEAVREMVDLYPTTDVIWCGDDIITNGGWSAEAVRIDNPPFDLTQAGVMVHRHVDSQIHRQFAHFTRASGDVAWGLPLED